MLIIIHITGKHTLIDRVFFCDCSLDGLDTILKFGAENEPNTGFYRDIEALAITFKTVK